MTATQRIYAIATPGSGVPRRDLEALMQFEAAHVWALYERGTVRELWSRTDQAGAVYVLEATPESARDALAAQPLARAGLVAFELAPVAAFHCLVDLFGTQTSIVEPAAGGPCHRRTERVLAIDRVLDARAAGAHAAEARVVWALLKAGVVREAHRRTDRPGTVLVLETTGLEEATQVVESLPSVRTGAAAFDLYGVGAFTGLDALMDGAL